jgi:hypothetical protein
LEPSQEERECKEEIFFKKMLRFLFLKEEPLTIMLTETLELLLSETQPTLTP